MLLICLLKFTLSITVNSFLSKMRDVMINDGFSGEQKFVAVIDAGSTGTRLNIFGFLVPGNILDFFSIERVSPGLHSFESKDDMEKNLKKLIDNSNKTLSSYGTSLEKVPVVFEATAGMRMIDPARKKKILNAVELTFCSNKIKLHDINILNGLNEGIYALETLSFLKNFNFNVLQKYGCHDDILRASMTQYIPDFCTNINMKKQCKYIGIFDMGGGSLQIAYEFEKSSSYNDPVHVIEGKDKKIFIASFDGWGLNEAMSVFKKFKNYKIRKKSTATEISAELMKDFKSLEKPNINDVNELYLLSYFYEKLTQLGCGRETTYNEIEKLYKKRCDDSSEQFCDEISYIISFIDSMNVDHGKKMFVVHDIAGINLNWSLSRAIMLL
ncbi:hypothetical protein EDEG_02886 [Edhazardia aedis USNM 41457]|uniref:Ppx/GppA phosphatase domain-containing protein n=1 Tax=Edhazardia aedis (strain USNM 41457) TaxID=1003232 RepID=J9DMX8_EDHAE|nr:hypothetical protein EDEG_02886 [Edhazardia aedis USNM 41457]|eukprot:EJW02702.1 hypothetical protein EDEG_02886 [Edhazardia aedis USNM 41457]